MAGVILNFGDVGHLFTNGNYEIAFLADHTDPDFVHWTFGDYPQKPSKVHLGDLVEGDTVFFTMTLQHAQTSERITHFVGYLRITEIVTVAELLEAYSMDHLRVFHPYCYNVHIQKTLGVKGENSEEREHQNDQECVLFVGDAAASRLIGTKPFPFDRALCQELFARFDPDTTPDNGDYNWYYNEPGYAETFGKRTDKNGELLTDQRMINAKFQNPPYIPDYLAEYLKGLIDVKPTANVRAKLRGKYGWRSWFNSQFDEILGLSDAVWKDLPMESIKRLLETLPQDLAYTLVSDLVVKDFNSEFKAYLLKRLESLKWKVQEFHF
ncbi:MAG: hypothetical protein R6U96_02300 [Promethearchaeia archaeon]